MAVKTSWAAGDVLTAADLTDTFAAKAATSSVGLTYITKGTVTNGAGLSVNNCFSSTYANYLVVIGITTTTTGFTLRLRNGGSDRTGNDYVSQTITSYTTNLSSAKATSTGYDLGAITAEGFVTLDVYGPFVSTAETHVRGRMYGYQTNVSEFVTRDFGLNYNVANSNDGFSLVGTGSTLTAWVYGYQTP